MRVRSLDVVEALDVVANRGIRSVTGGVLLVVNEVAKKLSATAWSQQSPFRLMLAMSPWQPRAAR
jgi:hypothetical protein